VVARNETAAKKTSHLIRPDKVVGVVGAEELLELADGVEAGRACSGGGVVGALGRGEAMVGWGRRLVVGAAGAVDELRRP
jgi:hypothetical protein